MRLRNRESDKKRGREAQRFVDESPEQMLEGEVPEAHQDERRIKSSSYGNREDNTRVGRKKEMSLRKLCFS